MLSVISVYEKKIKRKLNDTERKELLRLARENKHFKIAEDKYWSRIENKPVIPDKITASGLMNEIIRRGDAYLAEKGGKNKKFIIDEENQEVVKLLCMYFSDDPEFEKHDPDFSLNKGIFLKGANGTGKTMLMKLFRKNYKMSFSLITARQVALDYQSDGASSLAKYTNLLSIPINSYGHNRIGTCFDDCGEETDMRGHFHDGILPMEIIFKERYTKLPAISTHITTNISTYEFCTKVYGSLTDKRLSDRIKENYNQIFFPESATSRRR